MHAYTTNIFLSFFQVWVLSFHLRIHRDAFNFFEREKLPHLRNYWEFFSKFFFSTVREYHVDRTVWISRWNLNYIQSERQKTEKRENLRQSPNFGRIFPEFSRKLAFKALWPAKKFQKDKTGNTKENLKKRKIFENQSMYLNVFSNRQGGKNMLVSFGKIFIPR